MMNTTRPPLAALQAHHLKLPPYCHQHLHKLGSCLAFISQACYSALHPAIGRYQGHGKESIGNDYYYSNNLLCQACTASTAAYDICVLWSTCNSSPGFFLLLLRFLHGPYPPLLVCLHYCCISAISNCKSSAGIWDGFLPASRYDDVIDGVWCFSRAS